MGAGGDDSAVAGRAQAGLRARAALLRPQPPPPDPLHPRLQGEQTRPDRSQPHRTASSPLAHAFKSVRRPTAPIQRTSRRPCPCLPMLSPVRSKAPRAHAPAHAPGSVHAGARQRRRRRRRRRRQAQQPRVWGLVGRYQGGRWCCRRRTRWRRRTRPTRAASTSATSRLPVPSPPWSTPSRSPPPPPRATALALHHHHRCRRHHHQQH